ncbi:hypothetical protein GW17_00014813 [Ensete ventricosum]|nr:hypothetical protein GW17_00014813 [Ensete ventricosum]
MARGCIVVEVTTSSSTEPLLPSKVSHVASPVITISSGASDPASSGCVSTSPVLGTQWSLGLTSSWVFSSPTTSHLILCYASTHCAYDVMV